MANLARSNNDEIQDMPQADLAVAAPTASTRGRRPGAPIVRRNAETIKVKAEEIKVDATKIVESGEGLAGLSQTALDRGTAQANEEMQNYTVAYVKAKASGMEAFEKFATRLNESTESIAHKTSSAATVEQGTFFDDLGGMDFLLGL